ncbi:MAG: alpha/beta fold hydrolase [Casimicrobiaceae bacterium]
MPEPTLLIPGLASTPQFYAAQIPALWQFGPVMLALHTGADVFIRQQAAIIGRADSRPTLAYIDCPACVVVGDSDQPTPPARAQEIVTGIAGATLVTIHDCGHMSAIERPDEVTAALCAWKAT